MSSSITTAVLAPQEIVERVLGLPAGSDGAGRVVLVSETSEAVLRWANSTMTTNGHTTSRRVSVISMVAVDGGTAAGVVSSSEAITDVAQLADLVAASEHAARDAGPARDAMPLPAPGGDEPAWADGAAETSIGVFGPFVDGLAHVLAGPHRQFGFASHQLTTSWLGTTAGVRRRWVQPTGSVELNVKTPDLTGSAWTGASTPDFADVDVVALAAEVGARLEWGRRRVTLPAGRYETLLPPSAVADLMLYLAWSMDGRPAQEGRSALAGPDGPRTGERLTGLPLTLASDPVAPGLEYQPYLTATRSGDGVSVFDNGAPARRIEWVREGVINELGYSRAEAAEFGTAFTPGGDNLLLTGGSPATARRDGGGHRARPAADLPVVHPRRRPGDPAAHRPLPRRGLPGGGRRGRGRGGPQLPVQLLAARRPAPRVGRRRDGAHGPEGVEGLVHPHRHAPRAGPRVQHVLGLPGPLNSQGR